MIIKRQSHIPSCFLFLEKNWNILLSKRLNTWHMDWYYSLISWHVEWRESYKDCIIREAKEEAGIDIEKNDLRLVHIMYKNTNNTEDLNRVDLYFHINKWKNNIKNMEEHKCSELSWYNINELPANIINYTYKWILNIIKWEIYSEYYYK